MVKNIKEQSGKTIVIKEGKVTKHIKNIGEIHLVLRDKNGQVLEDRLTIDKQKKEKKDDNE